MQSISIALELNLYQKKLKYRKQKYHNKYLWSTRIRFDVNFCIGFVCFMVKGRNLLYYRNLFSSNGYEKNDKMILK